MKKLIAIALCLSVILTVMCACKPNDKDKGSSTNTAVESSDVQNESSEYSENKTSSIDDEVDETSSSKKDNSSKKDIAEKSSSEKTSSKGIDRNPTASVTTSDTIKLPDIDGNTLEIGAYHFNPIYTNNYYGIYKEVWTNVSLSMDKKLEELEDVISQGYFNTIILEVEHFSNEKLWTILEKYKMRVWFDIYELYNSSKQTIEEFMKPYDAEIQKIRGNATRWKMFNGFVFDENCHRNQSPEDFNATCKYLYTKYGKRNFPVFAPNEISNLWDDPSLGEMTTAAFEYVTDAAWDVYVADVRDGADNGYIVRDGHAAYPDIVDGKSFYRVVTNEMLKMAGHPVNVWFYPGGQTRAIPGGLNGATKSDEGFAKAHLEFFNELLKEYEHPGGMIIYTYAQWDPGDYGLQSHLSVKDENGKQKIRAQENQVWPEYSEYVKELTRKYRTQKTNPLLKPTGK